MPPDVLHFRIERFDDPDDGLNYVVSGEEIALVTEGDTIEEARHNLREAVELYIEGDDLPQLPRIESYLQIPLCVASKPITLGANRTSSYRRR
jgi:predicted RNase H-like HicB family nuclease